MESSTDTRTGEIGEHVAIILVTVAQLIFLVYFYESISWPTTGPDGSTVRMSMLTDAYFAWLPFPVTASILVIVASIVMIVYDRYWFHRTVWMLFCITGLTVVVSLLTLFPFDFSVLANPTAANLVLKVLTAFLIFMACFYGIAAVVLLVQVIRYAAKPKTSSGLAQSPMRSTGGSQSVGDVARGG